ncbi:MAG: DsbA family protein [Pseudomonadota bacterium]
MTLNKHFGLGAALIGAFLLGAIVVAYSSASDDPAQVNSAATPSGEGFSQAETEEIRALIGAYLMENPEVILESVDLHRQRLAEAEAAAARAAMAEVKADIVSAVDGFEAGKDVGNAKVAVVEFFDYQCGFCKRAAPLIKDMISTDDDVKVVFRELPIFGDDSENAAASALAARDQGKFLDLHFAFMEASGKLTADRIADIANTVGVDIDTLEDRRVEKDVSQSIANTQALAQAVGIEGTPAFVVASLDGDYLELIPGFRPDELAAAIDAAKQASN